jgi:DNA (cytosine-5)-methyltransferase 1
VTDLVLSLFPGIGLLDRGFESQGFCVVRGPDLLWGGDVRRFSVPAGRFEGVIGGSPCQDFSKLRRVPESGGGVELLREFLRVVTEASPDWFLLENVPGVPSVTVPAYVVQRFDVSAWEFGVPQGRRRHFQFGSVTGRSLVVPRAVTEPGALQAAVTATEGRRAGRRDWPAFCALMGVTELELPGMTKAARYAAVGNGVPVPVAAGIAAAIRRWCDSPGDWFGAVRACGCGCGRVLQGRQRSASAACRKRLERGRRGYVTGRGAVSV